MDVFVDGKDPKAGVKDPKLGEEFIWTHNGTTERVKFMRLGDRSGGPNAGEMAIVVRLTDVPLSELSPPKLPTSPP